MTRTCGKCKADVPTYYLVRTRKGIVVECPRCHVVRPGDKKITKEKGR